jgi:site-specific recombinase XerC
MKAAIMSQANSNIIPSITDGNRLTASDFMGGAYSSATLRAYHADFGHFSAWCECRNLAFLPPTEQTVGDYLADQTGVVKMNTMKRRLASISYYCRQSGLTFNFRSPWVRDVLRGIARTTNICLTQSAAFSADHIKAMVLAQPPTLTGKRNKAIILIGFCGAFRRSEILAIDVEHVSIGASAMDVSIPRSKNDQKGKGAVVHIAHGLSPHFCPVIALQDWVEAAGITHGPLFRKVTRWGKVNETRLCDDAAGRIIQNAAKAIGMVAPDGERISSHGLRAGFVTAAFIAGASDEQVMAHSRHSTTSGMRGYIRRNFLMPINSADVTGL